MKKIVVGIMVVIIIIASITPIILRLMYLPMFGTIVQSGSMMHGSSDQDDIIDKDDIVEIEKIDGKNDIVTFIQGKEKGYKKYGEYGDVIAYKRNGLGGSPLVIHRAILWLEFNEEATEADPDPGAGHFDIPELGMYNKTGEVVIETDFPAYYPDENDGPLIIDLNRIYNLMRSDPHSGFITHGDHNPIPNIDQYSTSTPIKSEWIEGKVVLFDNSDIVMTYSIIFTCIIIAIVCAIILVVNFNKDKRKKRLEYTQEFHPGMVHQYRRN